MNQPTDEQVIEHIRAHPGCKLYAICEAHDIVWCQLPFGYTPEAKALARQLQHLRRAGQLQTTQGQRWEVT